MPDLKLDQQTRGTRIIWGQEVYERRNLLDRLRKSLEGWGFEEIILPSLEPADIYTDKAGPEILGQMYTFPDKKGRQLCLRPEGTATCQLLASQTFRNQKDVKLWYETRCWRYERPQAGRYREFTQVGVEVLNPNKQIYSDLVCIAYELIAATLSGIPGPQIELDKRAKRGLAYYIEDGFEITCPWLGAQKQVCGGGKYKEGWGFAIGLDRLLLARRTRNPNREYIEARVIPGNG